MLAETSNLAAIILAAGRGTRMKSDRAKVLHEIAGRPMLLYVLETVYAIAVQHIVLVLGHQADAVRQRVISEGFAAEFALQEPQRGTAHAVACALPLIPIKTDNILILYGDVPFLRADTLVELVRCHQCETSQVTLLAFHRENPFGYGRVIFNHAGNIIDIVEEADATEQQRRVKTVNSGVYCIRRAALASLLPQIKANNAQEEYYLTDIVRLAVGSRVRINCVITPDPAQLIGINSPEDLIQAENYYLKQLKQQKS